MQPENNGRENAAYAKGPLEDMTIQDAVTVIAVHAAQLDSNESEKDIQDIERILREHALFRDLSTDVRRLVNTYATFFYHPIRKTG
jgi:hypothetical protein